MGTDLRQQMKAWKWHPTLGAGVLSFFVIAFFFTILFSVAYLLGPEVKAAEISWPDLSRPWLYSFKVAIITCFICALLAPVIAWSFWHLNIRNSAGEQLMALPYCLPTVAVGSMIVLAFGNSGSMNQVLKDQLHIIHEPISFLYQDWSPLLGTVWMNLSLGTMLLLRQWRTIPSQYWHQADLMQFTPYMCVRWIIAPFSKNALLPWLGIVFLACFNSFGLMLVLSGSPSATTIELATWQSLYLEADWSKAAALMMLQLISATAFLVILWNCLRTVKAQKPGASEKRRETPSVAAISQRGKFRPLSSVAAWLIAIVFAAFYAIPLISLAIDAIKFILAGTTSHYSEIISSMTVSAINAVACATIVGLVVTSIVPAQYKANGYHRTAISKWFAATIGLPAIIPGMVSSFAILVISIRMDWTQFKMPGIWLVQSMLMIPVTASLYWSGWTANLAGSFRIREELGLSWFSHCRSVELPAMWTWSTTVAAVAGGLSFSDVTVVSLLGESDSPPLTILLTRLMGSYRFAEASLVIFILVGMSAFLFYLSTTRLGGTNFDRL